MTLRKVNVLICDDKVDNLTVLEAVLDSNDYQLFRASSGYEALKLVAKEEFACILLDVQMPGMDGFETAVQIRRLAQNRNVPIIFVTAIFGDEAYVHQGYEAGAVDYIFKPFNPVVLRSKVAVFVDLFMKTKLLLQQANLKKEKEIAELRLANSEQERATQQKYRDLVDSISNCIIWSSDSQALNISFVSPKAENLTGYELAKWNESSFLMNHTVAEDRALFLNAVQVARQMGTSELEHRFLTFDHHQIWFKTTLRLVTSGDGVADELRGLSVDITQQKMNEVISKQNEERFRTLAEAMPQMVWTANENGLSEYVNKRWCDFTGISYKEQSLWTWKDVVHSDDLEKTQRVWNEARLQGEDFETEYRMKRYDGQYQWQLGRAYPLKDSRGEVIQWFGTCTNIEDQKRAEASEKFLSESSVTLSSSLDFEKTLNMVAQRAIPKFATWSMVHLLDEDEKIVLASAGHQDQTMMSKISLINESFSSLLCELVGVNQVVNTRNTQNRESVFTDPKLNPQINHVFISLLKDLGAMGIVSCPLISRGKILGTFTLVSAESIYTEKDVKLIEDLARRAATAVDNAQLYKNAENAIHTRDEFLSIASHELRTPLTPLKLQFHMLKKLARESGLVEKSQGKFEKMIERSDRQLDRITKLIEDLLTVSRSNLGMVNLDYKKTNLCDLVGDVVEQFSDQLSASGIKLKLDLCESVIGLWDPFRIEQVIVNLLTNAIKYGDHKPIEISVSETGGVAQLAVKDHGIGINPKDQKRIFGLFERAVLVKHYGGLGLGLYIVNKIIDQHQGSISVWSEIGQGSKFTVELPLNSAHKIEDAQSLVDTDLGEDLNEDLGKDLGEDLNEDLGKDLIVARMIEPKERELHETRT
jgi:PAS domain S-box-containing protein